MKCKQVLRLQARIVSQCGFGSMVLRSCPAVEAISVDSNRLPVRDHRVRHTLVSPAHTACCDRHFWWTWRCLSCRVDNAPGGQQLAHVRGFESFLPLGWKRSPQPTQCLDGSTHICNFLLWPRETLSSAGLHTNLFGHRNKKTVLRMYFLPSLTSRATPLAPAVTRREKIDGFSSSSNRNTRCSGDSSQLFHPTFCLAQPMCILLHTGGTTSNVERSVTLCRVEHQSGFCLSTAVSDHQLGQKLNQQLKTASVGACPPNRRAQDHINMPFAPLMPRHCLLWPNCLCLSERQEAQRNAWSSH